MDFIALDFETSTTQQDSPCDLGIVVVREVRNRLIKPSQWPCFSPWNVMDRIPDRNNETWGSTIMWREYRHAVANFRSPTSSRAR